nr:hypothetical protein [Tanacetum cinerariifolium]
EGTGSRPGVPDVPSDDSEEELSWNSSDVDKQTKGREESEGDKTDESDEDDGEEETTKICEQEVAKSDEGDDEATESDREYDEDDDNNEEDQGLRIGEEERMQEEEDAKELYRYVDINQGQGLQVSQETEGTHVILTPTQSDAQQESSSTSSFMTNLLNPITDLGLEWLFTTGSTTRTPIPSPQSTMTPSIISTFTSASQLPTPPTQIPSLDLQSLPTFASVFRFEDRVKSLEDNFSNIPGIKIIKEHVKSQVKAQVTRILPRIEEAVNVQLEAEVLTSSSHSSRTSYAVVADFSEMELKKIMIEKMEGNNEDKRMMIKKDPPLDQTKGQKDEEKEGSMHQLALHLNKLPGVQADLPQGLNLDSCLPVSLLLQRNLCSLPVRWRNPHIQCLRQVQKINLLFKHLSILNGSYSQVDHQHRIVIGINLPSAGSDRGSKRPRGERKHASASTPSEPATGGAGRTTTGSQSRQLSAIESAFAKEPMQPTCQMEEPLHPVFETEEVYKVTTDQLDWVNPEGQQYPHNLLQPLPLIPDNQGRSKFYGFVVNRESALNVYSKRRIIAVTELKIMEWHNYKHLDWVSEHSHPEESGRSSTGS